MKRSSQTKIALLALAGAVLLCGWQAVGSAESEATDLDLKDAPEVRVVVADTDRWVDYARHIIGLAPKEQQDQAEVLAGFLDVFLIGVDRNRPALADTFSQVTPMRYLLHVPVPPREFRTFNRDNLQPIGISVDSVIGENGMYRLGARPPAAFTGWMLYEPNKRGNFAFIAEAKEEVPAELGDSTPSAEKLLGEDFDAALELINKTNAVEARSKRFIPDRDQMVADMKPNKGETKTAFALRKLTLMQSWENSMAMYAEAAKIYLGVNLDTLQNIGTADLTMTVLPETQLMKVIKLLGNNSRYASVPTTEDPILSGRIHLPLDERFQKQLLDLSDAVETNSLAIVEDDESRSAAQKKAGSAATKALFGFIKKTVEAGTLDGFIEIETASNGKFVAVGAMHTPYGNEGLAVIQSFKGTKTVTTIDESVETYKDIPIHRVDLNPEGIEDLTEMFGTTDVYIGTASDAIWYAGGQDALAKLKSTIDAAASGNMVTSPETVLRAKGHGLPVTEMFLDRVYPTLDPITRAMLRGGLSSGDDRAEIEFLSTAEGLDGSAKLQSGSLGFIGRYLARFSKENLDE
ncbi:hypothetical protein [Calycomorphotria hydatis]|uniref:DUF3352 domain-containing protein n=1 Tax=Calycomorphotria hydatis TaxID=2528027 RepID=A0A517T759_9PLAN|nr:hypothetical protein [Calycomorphotria hydatis]QDT64213.1 hypothetical protein V22_14440 [Calycomorphotria hydatis]